MDNKKTLRKGRSARRSFITEMMSPNVRIAALLVVAIVMLGAVASVSVINGSKKSAKAEASLIAANAGKVDTATAANDTNDADGRVDAPMRETEASEAVTQIENTPVKAAAPSDSTEELSTDVAKSDDTDSKEVQVMTIPFTGVIKYDDDNELVADIQDRYMQLNYMDPDDTTTHFGPITRDATAAFQRRNGLEVTGKVDAETYKVLMSKDALVYMMSLGDDGDDVSAIQDRLYEMGYMDIKPTGYFGETTEAAVKAFQKNNDLLVDGKVGTETKEMLYNPDAMANVWSMGDSSDTLIPYQKKLIALGYLSTEADGEYGSATKSAVKRFQDRNGISVDGYLGPKTRDILMSKDAIANAYTIGDDNSAVEKIQKRLYALGYVKKSSITGYFGSATEYAVKAFQKRNGLTADGRVGTKTLKAINDSDAKKAPSDYKFYGSGSSSSSGSSSGSGSSGSSGSGSNYTAPEGASVSALISAARSRLGCRYVTGGKGPEKFDCSGLVYWCLNRAGVKQSYLTSYGWRSVSKYQRISKIDNLRAGDIIVFYGHVGIIVSSDEMIDASSSKGKVVRRSFKGSWSRRNFICGYRIFD